MASAYEALRDEFVDMCCSIIPVEKRQQRAVDAPAEFDKLCADERVVRVAMRRVEVSSSNAHPQRRLYVATVPLVMVAHDDKVPRALGDMLIEVVPQWGAVLCENLTGMGEEFIPGSETVLDCVKKGHHPHVGPTKATCFGEMEQKVWNWFSEGKLAHIALFTVNFLEVARSYGSCISYTAWPPLEGQALEDWKKRRRV